MGQRGVESSDETSARDETTAVAVAGSAAASFRWFGVCADDARRPRECLRDQERAPARFEGKYGFSMGISPTNKSVKYSVVSTGTLSTEFDASSSISNSFSKSISGTSSGSQHWFNDCTKREASVIVYSHFFAALWALPNDSKLS